MSTTYAIEFRWPEGVSMYAGLHKGAFGWAPTLKTALLFEDAEKAQNAIRNAYGDHAAQYAHVVPVKAGSE